MRAADEALHDGGQAIDDEAWKDAGDQAQSSKSEHGG